MKAWLDAKKQSQGVGFFLVGAAALSYGAEAVCPKSATPDSAVLWCDSFEPEDFGPGESVGDNYYEFDDDEGEHVSWKTTDAIHGDYVLRARWQAGEQDAGHFIRTFGQSPVRSQSHVDRDFREIYWRFYVKYPGGFVGFPDKLTRLTIFAAPSWAQAMIAHLWAWEGDASILALDPASGINDAGQLATTKYNDFPNLQWLGMTAGNTPLGLGRWNCVEAHVRLNDPGMSNGVFEYWIDGEIQAKRSNLNWVSDWTEYGLNALVFSHYWNASSPVQQERYLDALVVSTDRVGCMLSTAIDLSPPANLRINP